MKENTAVDSLSKHNQIALTLISRIRTGIANGTDRKRIGAYTLHFYRHFLKEQFLREEAMYMCLSESNMLRIKACSEHALLSPLFERMHSMEFSPSDLQKLATILEKHIRFETEKVFPHVESLNYTPHRHTSAVYNDSWSDPFWAGASTFEV
jgi:hypothetical protein